MAPPEAAPPLPAAAFDAGWLATRRWFRGKSRPIDQVTLHDAAALDGGVGWLLVLAVRYADGGQERYLLPVVRDGDAFREPNDGEGAWRGLLAQLVAGDDSPGTEGGFHFTAMPALEGLLRDAPPPERLEESRLEVEQSNTSVRLGDVLMLKLYRLLEPGVNPELEVSAFLTEVGFGHAPALAGSVSYQPGDGEPAAAAMLSQLVPARRDGWQWALDALASPPIGPQQALAGAAQIGGITAELHEALASRPETPGFPARAATAAETEAWRVGAEGQLDAALAALSGEPERRLERLAPAIRERLGAIGRADEPALSRIHGDYHLGQLIRTDEGFAIVDFEGEPARPMAERRLPSSPLRDVAGMLRSLDYAARTAAARGPDGFAADAWLDDARATLLTAYGSAAENHPDLLAAFEIEKACYEVRYELNNRPDWLWLPLAALERLAA
jgi:trehalose synthase-fused probable maltokinase